MQRLSLRWQRDLRRPKRLGAGRELTALATAVSGFPVRRGAPARQGTAEPGAARQARWACAPRGGAGRQDRIAPAAACAGRGRGAIPNAHSGAWLLATRKALEVWSGREQIVLLDAGRSERYGCVAAEFIDPHHALPECYARVLSRFFEGHPQLLRSGAAANR